MAHLHDLQGRRTPWVYLLEPTKSIMVVALQNFSRSKAFFCKMVMKVVTRSRYFGGFIGDWDTEATCMAEKVEG